MLKKHFSRKSSFKFIQKALLGVALFILGSSIALTALPSQTASAAANPQGYSDPKGFDGMYGFVFKNKDTIILAKSTLTDCGAAPNCIKDSEVEFKRVENNPGLDNNANYFYDGTVTFNEDNLTRSFIISIKKDELDSAFQANKPIPISDIAYSTTIGGPNVGTNDASKLFAGINSDRATGFVFISSTLTDKDSVGELSTGGTTENPDEPQLECETSFTNPLTFLMCPLVTAATEAVNQLDNAITNQMTVDTGYYFDTSTEFYTAWSSFRYIALALLVVIALVMILSEALSLDIFDAYSIRKVLPRLLMAVILITLSWSLMKFAVEISNDVGQGIRAIIYAPFASMPDAVIGGGESSAAFTGILIGLGALGILGILSFALTALMAVFIAFIVLVLRQMLIIFLIITAPVAIVAYILPNTQKVWKIWWDFFSKALLAFPIIVAFIATGRVFSKVAASAPGAGILQTTIAFGAYFLPYFMIPTAFKLAGGAIATISGIANDRSKGAFDRVSKYRQGRSKENMQKLKTGSRFNERGQFGKYNPVGRFNKVTQGASLGFSGGFGLGERGKGATDMALRAASAEAMKNPMMQQLAYNDDAILAMGLSAGSSAFAKKQLATIWKDEKGNADTARIDKAVAQAAAVGFNRENALAGMDLAARNKFFSLPGGEDGMNALLSTADQMAGVTRNGRGEVQSGNATMAENIMGGIEYQARGAGRFDLGHHDYKTWKPRTLGSNGAWGKAGMAQHAQGTSASIKSFGQSFREDFVKNKSMDSAIALLEMRNMLPNATSANQDVINDTLTAAGVDLSSSESVESQLARLMGQPTIGTEIRNRARVYEATPMGERQPGEGGAPGGGGGNGP